MILLMIERFPRLKLDGDHRRWVAFDAARQVYRRRYSSRR